MAIQDEDIDFSDIPELDETLWKQAELVEPDRTAPAILAGARAIEYVAVRMQPLDALQVLPNASCGQHSPISHQHHPPQPETRTDLVHLRRHRTRVPRRALEDLDRHRTAFRRTQQPDHDLQLAAFAVARVAALGQLAMATLEVARGHVIQDEGVLPQMAPGQGFLDGLLAGTQQPVHGPVDLVFIDGAETEGLREGGEGGLAGERPGSGQLGLGVDDSGDDQIPVPAPGAGQQSIQLEFLEGGPDGGDVTMGERAGAVEDIFGVDEGLALEGSADELDDGVGEMGDVAEGFMLDPAVLAEGATEEMGAVDL